MVEVQISDSTYELARQAALAQHVSLGEFIEQAVQNSLGAGALYLTEEQIATVRVALEDVNAGRVFTAEQARADLEAHKKEWRTANPS